MSFENIVIEKGEFGVTVLKIDRPKALNALNAKTLQELRTALKEIAKDPEIRVLILTGGGEKAFVAGGDISEMEKMSAGEASQFSLLGHDVGKLLESLPQPTIAAVHGFALGGGTELATACDFIYASEKAVFGQPEVCLGIIPGFGGCFRLARFVGFPRAKELVFSGRKINATEAQQMGLCLEIYPVDGFLNKVKEKAKEIALQSASAVGTAKKIMNEFMESSGINFKADTEAHSFGRLMNSHDQREGMGAFLEKRKPKFQGLTE